MELKSQLLAGLSRPGLLTERPDRALLFEQRHRSRKQVKVERMLKALVIGITGQDGGKLAEWLLTKDYEVHGIVRPGCTENLERIAHLADRIYLHEVNLLNQPSISEVLREVRPDEVYNLEPTTIELRLLVGG